VPRVDEGMQVADGHAFDFVFVEHRQGCLD
jgi:hypothetical protein